MLLEAGINSKGKRELRCEVISTATKLDNIMVFYGKDAKYMRCLRTFGVMAVITINKGKKIRSKLDNTGKTCMFIRYADDQSRDVYRFLNIHTKRIIMSRDVRWLIIIWKHYRKKSIYARRQLELFLDEEKSSLEDERSFSVKSPLKKKWKDLKAMEKTLKHKRG